MTSWTGVAVFEGVFKSRKILQNKKIANDVAEPVVSPIQFFKSSRADSSCSLLHNTVLIDYHQDLLIWLPSITRVYH